MVNLLMDLVEFHMVKYTVIESAEVAATCQILLAVRCCSFILQLSSHKNQLAIKNFILNLTIIKLII